MLIDWGSWPKHLEFTSHRYHELGTGRRFRNIRQARKATNNRPIVLHYLSNKGNYVPYKWIRPQKQTP